MHPHIRFACEYAILQAALQVAVATSGDDEDGFLYVHTLVGALRFEMLDSRGTCALLQPIYEIIVDLEPRDLVDAGVQAELCARAKPVHVHDVAAACIFARAVDGLGTSVSVVDLVLGGVEITKIPDSIEALNAQLEADEETTILPSSAGKVPRLAIPTEETMLACKEWTSLQKMAFDLMAQMRENAC